MERLLLIAILIVCAGSSYGSEKQEIAKCAAKQSDTARLVCYDALARSLGVDKPKTTTTKGKGEWSIRVEKSPIDDSKNVYLYVNSQETVRSGYKVVRPSLFIRCAENTTNVFLNWELYLGLDSTQMLTRFDDAKATTDTWSISTDNKSVFVRGSDISFAKKMMKYNKMLVQITPYGENSVMTTFNIRGLSEAIKPLREACNW